MRMVKAFVFLLGLAVVSSRVWAYGDAQTTMNAKVADNKAFSITITPEECWFTPEFYARVKAGVYFLHSFLKQELGLEFPSDMEFKIRIFGNRSAYQDYENKTRQGEFQSLGFYKPGTNEVVLQVVGTEEDTYRTVMHETTHAFLRHSIPWIPRWINEGLAQYFEMMVIRRQEVGILPNPGNDYGVQQMLSSGTMMSLAAYLQITDIWEDYYRHQPLLHEPYGMGWSVVYFLMSSDTGRQSLRNILEYLKNHQKEDGASLEALGIYYPGGMDQLEKDWHVWIPGQRQVHVWPFDETAYKILNA